MAIIYIKKIPAPVKDSCKGCFFNDDQNCLAYGRILVTCGHEPIIYVKVEKDLDEK